MFKPVAILTALALSFSLMACSNASFTSNGRRGNPANDPFLQPTGVPTQSNVPGVINCHVDLSSISDCFAPFNVQGVNVWIVLDASSSFLMRERVGRQLARNFETGLKNNLPLTISVIAAHTSNSPFGSFGPDVFYRQSNEPLTINVSQQSDFVTAREHLVDKFDFYMKADPLAADYWGGPDNDKHTGANELGLLNLANAMNRIPEGHPTRQPGWGWLVVFAADENDPCVPDPNGNNPRGETEMYNNDCAVGIGNGRITPQSVFQQMQGFANGRQMMVSGVLNVNGNVVLGDPKNSGVGHGYLEVIQMANGVAAQLPGGGSNTGSSWF